MTHSNLMADAADHLLEADQVGTFSKADILSDQILAKFVYHRSEVEQTDLGLVTAGLELGEHMGPDLEFIILSRYMVSLGPTQEDSCDHTIAFQEALKGQSMAFTLAVCNLLESCKAFEKPEDRIADRPLAELLDHTALPQCQALQILV